MQTVTAKKEFQALHNHDDSPEDQELLVQLGYTLGTGADDILYDWWVIRDAMMGGVVGVVDNDTYAILYQPVE